MGGGGARWVVGALVPPCLHTLPGTAGEPTVFLKATSGLHLHFLPSLCFIVFKWCFTAFEHNHIIKCFASNNMSELGWRWTFRCTQQWGFWLRDSPDPFLCPFLFLEFFWLAPIHSFIGQGVTSYLRSCCVLWFLAFRISCREHLSFYSSPRKWCAVIKNKTLTYHILDLAYWLVIAVSFKVTVNCSLPPPAAVSWGMMVSVVNVSNAEEPGKPWPRCSRLAAHSHPPQQVLVALCLSKCGLRVGVGSHRARTDVCRLWIHGVFWMGEARSWRRGLTIRSVHLVECFGQFLLALTWVAWFQGDLCSIKSSPPCSTPPSLFPKASDVGGTGSGQALTFPQGWESPAQLPELLSSFRPGCVEERWAHCSCGPHFLRKPG